MQPLRIRDWLKSDIRLFREQVAKKGFSSAMARTARVLSWRFYPPRRRFADNLKAEMARGLEFDRLHHVDTTTEISLANVGVPQEDVDRGNGLYRGVWAPVFDEAMRAMPLEYSSFTFADYGSGKGRALFLAAEYPFKKIVGVEFVPTLHEISINNIKTYKSKTQKCTDLSVECCDALAWPPPNGPLVCFFFNPFDYSTMRRVIGHIIDSHRASPREIYLVYVNVRNISQGRKGFAGRPELKRVAHNRNYVWYRII
jgi:hypothetical protein